MPFSVQRQWSPDEVIDRTSGVIDARLSGSVISGQIFWGGTGTVDSEILRDENRVTEEFYRDSRRNHPEPAVSFTGSPIVRSQANWPLQRSDTEP